MIDQLLPTSLQESVSHCVGNVLKHQQRHPETELSQYEIEIRLGAVTCENKAALLGANKALNEASCKIYFPAAPNTGTSFRSGVSAFAFNDATEFFLDEYLGLCASIASLRRTAVVRHSGLRFEKDLSTDAVVVTQKSEVGAHCDYVETTPTPDAEPLHAVRIATSLETVVVPTAAQRAAVSNSQEIYIKERVSVRLYDTTAIAPVVEEWATAEGALEYIETNGRVFPTNWWRIDFTRLPVQSEYQIEIELELANAIGAYKSEFTISWPDKIGDEKSLMAYVRYRLLSTLGECLYRVQRSMYPSTRPDFCRAL